MAKDFPENSIAEQRAARDVAAAMLGKILCVDCDEYFYPGGMIDTGGNIIHCLCVECYSRSLKGQR